MNESQVEKIDRLPKPDNYEALAAAFRKVWPGVIARDLPAQMQGATEMADKLSPPKKEPELPQVASGGSYL